MDNPDLTLGVEFFTKPIQNAAKSAEAKRPIFEDREYVKIAVPGDSKTVHVAPAHERHYNPAARTQMTYAERFPEVYAQFQNGIEAAAVGTPLIASGLFPESKVQELKAKNFTTVEQLAGASDAVIRKSGMGMRELVEAAKGYLDKSQGMAEVDALRAELAALKAQMAPAPVEDDEFDGFSDDDLKNMIKDAGEALPAGRPSRDKLVAKIRELSEKADD